MLRGLRPTTGRALPPQAGPAHRGTSAQYFLYLANEKKVARATATIALCGIKFFYEQTLQRQWPTLQLIRPPRQKKLPVVLSREEVRRSLGAVRLPVYRACLTTIYAGGLRLLEGARLQVPDIDSDRMLFHFTARARKTATCRCPSPPWRCSAPSGEPIAPRCGCSRRPPGTVCHTAWPITAARYTAAACKAPSSGR